MGRTWDRALPLDKYRYDYSTKDRRKIALVTQAFPHIVKGAGHLPQVEKADEFLALFRAFASQLPR